MVLLTAGVLRGSIGSLFRATTALTWETSTTWKSTSWQPPYLGGVCRGMGRIMTMRSLVGDVAQIAQITLTLTGNAALDLSIISANVTLCSSIVSLATRGCAAECHGSMGMRSCAFDGQGGNATRLVFRRIGKMVAEETTSHRSGSCCMATVAGFTISHER